jgi:hypothetical protein
MLVAVLMIGATILMYFFAPFLLQIVVLLSLFILFTSNRDLPELDPKYNFLQKAKGKKVTENPYKV